MQVFIRSKKSLTHQAALCAIAGVRLLLKLPIGCRA